MEFLDYAITFVPSFTKTAQKGNNKGGQRFRAICQIFNRKDTRSPLICQTFILKNPQPNFNKELRRMAKLTKEKVKSMLPVDIIVVPCDSAAEVDSAVETARQARAEMGPRADSVRISKSNVTLTVVIRTGV